MVWFQCEVCGENLKKPKLANHFRRCSAYKLSCIDCGQTFSQESVQSHTQCISEAMLPELEAMHQSLLEHRKFLLKEQEAKRRSKVVLLANNQELMKIKGSYVRHKDLKVAEGIKISAQGLEHAIAGTALYEVGPNDDLEDIKKDVTHNMDRVMSQIDKSGEGVYVQYSTLGSLEALTEFLKSPVVNIPHSDFSISPVHKKNVMNASVMLEKKKEYATILAFDVKVMPDTRELAATNSVKIFAADIIYHLSDQFKAYNDELKEEMNKEEVFPRVL